MPENNPLAIIGDEDVVLGFGALGFKTYALKEAREFKRAAEDIVRSNTAICLVQDNIYRANEDELNNYRSLALPIFIPFSNGSTPLTMALKLSRSAKAAKTDLLESVVRDIRLRATGAF